jgi:predicted MPP superfamily phosphohydrolase
MKKSGIIILQLFISLSLALAQEKATIKIDIQDGPNPWSNLELNNSQETFQFAVVTDRTGGHRPGVFLDGIQKLNLLQPEFVMSVGDLIEGYTEDTARLNWEWNQFNGFIDSLQMPFFYIPGNHDMTNKVMKDKWEELFGRAYYHFIYKDVLFLCLNSEDNYRGAGRGTIDDKQFSYVKKVLNKNKSVKWTLLFMHQPLWNQQDTKRWKDVENLLEDRKHTVFVGHNHRYRKYNRNNGKYFVLATTGGGSSLRGPNFGEFDHVVWITMTNNGPIIANLLLEGIWDENVMNEKLANFIFPISNDMPISLTPSFVDEPAFSQINPVLKISNNTDKLMKVELEALANNHMTLDPYALKDTIQPNDVATIPLNVSCFKPGDLHDMAGIKLNVQISYELENRKDVQLSEVFSIKPAIKNDLLQADATITVDGNLEEWKQMDYTIDEGAYAEATPFTHTGTADASGQFSVRYDDKHLYIAAKIIDDEILVKNGSNPIYQDAALIFIDPRPAGHYNRTSQSNLFSDWTLIAISPDEEGTIYQKKRLPAGTQCHSVRTEDGYEVEAAIPLSYLKEHQPEGWKNTRVNVMINDYDQNGNHVSRISWQPNWTDKDNYLGSGTFFR